MWLFSSGFRSRPETWDNNLAIARGGRVISLYTNKSLRSVGTDRRDGASWIDLQDGFSSGCRDPATTAAIDDLTVLRTPKREWKYPCFGRLRLSLHSLNGIIVIR